MDSSDVAVLVAGDKAAILQEITNEDGLTSEDDQDEKEDTFMYCNLFWVTFLLGKPRDEATKKTPNFPVQNNRIACFFEDIESPSVWLRFSFVNHFVSGYVSKALGLVPLFDDMKAVGWRRRQVFFGWAKKPKVENGAFLINRLAVSCKMVGWADTSVENWDSRCCHQKSNIDTDTNFGTFSKPSGFGLVFGKLS